MTTPTDERRLVEIKERAEKATRGQWKETFLGCIRISRTMIIGSTNTDYTLKQEDESFIAHARTDIPYLLSTLRSKEEEIRRLADAFEKFLGDIGHPQDSYQRDMIAKARAAIQGTTK